MMRWMRGIGPRIATVALGSAAMLVTGAGGALASSGYGPPAPAAPSVPGGYSAVVTSQTIGPAGGKIGPLSVDGITTALTVPFGAFPASVQITLTAPNLAAVSGAGFAGHRAVAGVGIQVQERGAVYPGTFLKPLSLTMSSSSITASSVVVVWNGSVFVTESSASLAAGSATVTFNHDPNFAVLAPTGTAASTIPGATGATTGKPFLGEALLAGLLVLLGATGLGYARRRRTGV